MAANQQCNVPEIFPFSVRLGLIFIAQAAGLSAIAIVCLLSYIVVSFHRSSDSVFKADQSHSTVQ